MDNPNGENQENKQLQGDERPPRVEDELPEPPIMEDKPRNRSAGGIMENIWFKAIVAAVASVVVIVYALVPMFGGGSYVTKKDFEYNMGNISTTINDAVSTLNTKAAALDTALKIGRAHV